MKNSPLIILLVIISYLSQTVAQPTIEWELSFGSSGWDTAECIQQTNDGGYIITGYAATNDNDAIDAPGGGDIWVIKLDNSGVLEWQKFYGGSGSDGGSFIIQTSDGGYILTGSSNSNDGQVGANYGNLDVWVIKLDVSGNIEWEENYGGSGTEVGNQIQQTSDGGYVIAAFSESSDGHLNLNQGESDIWIFKINNEGIFEWGQSYGGSSRENLRSIDQTTDGGFIVAGFTESSDGDVIGDREFADFWILKLNSQGIIEWKKTYGGSNADDAHEIQQTSDGGYIVSGWAPSFDGDIDTQDGPNNGDFWILKIDASGSIEWEESFGGTVFDRSHSIQQTSDGGYISTGQTAYNTGDYNVLTIKVDAQGNLEWEKAMGGSLEDHSEHIRETSDGGYILCGKSWSNDGDASANKGLSDIWIVKLAPLQTSTQTLEIAGSAKVFPNPSNGDVSIFVNEMNLSTLNISIVDNLGRTIYSTISDTKTTTITGLPKGIFWCHITGKDFFYSEKIISL